MGPPGSRKLSDPRAIGDYGAPGSRLWGHTVYTHTQYTHNIHTQYTYTQNTHTHTEQVLERWGCYNLGIFKKHRFLHTVPGFTEAGNPYGAP